MELGKPVRLASQTMLRLGNTAPIMMSAWGYQPLVAAAVAFALGIMFDAYFAPSIAVVFIGAWAALAAWCLATLRYVMRRREGRETAAWVSSAILLVTIGIAGAAWHHVYWNVYRPSDIGNWAPADPHPAAVRGVLIEEPIVVPAEEPLPLRTWPKPPRTVTGMKLEAIRVSGRWQPASGQARLVLDGEVTDLSTGDRIEVIGSLSRPGQMSNPGEFDYRDYLRRRRTRANLWCDGRVAVRRLPKSTPGGMQDWPEKIGGAAESVLRRRLSCEHFRTAAALLLGRYVLLQEDVRELFLRTGTMHLLAISGLHVGILCGLLWWLLRLLLVPRKLAAVGVMLIAGGYALVTDLRPPVLRAAVLLWVIMGAIVFDLRSRRANSLALAALIVLAVNPTDLFSRGFQLSFLAVASIFWLVGPVWQWLYRQPEPLDQLISATEPSWKRAARACVRRLAFAGVLSAVVWVVNTPLVAARFHLFSPIAVPLTIILVPLVFLALATGFGLLLTDAWIPALAESLAKLFSFFIGTMAWCVELGAGIPGGHWYIPGPPDWWLVGLYGGGAVALLWPRHGWTGWRWAAAAAGWMAIGLAIPAWRTPPGRLECQVLAVGNGSAAVLRLPDDRTVLVDAGQVTGPQVGSRQIAPALWAAGVTRIDAVFASHADVDHFNGLPQLAQRFAIGQVFVPPHFAQSDQAAVRLTRDLLSHRGIPLRICLAGDRFDLGRDLMVQVLHPPVRFGGSDNEQSLVLLVDYRGKRILLPGDLEGEGLLRLLSCEPVNVDVLVAPHHGSRLANPPELADWCTPELVVVSQGRPRFGRTLEAYRQAGIPVLTTHERGAITLTVDQAGIRVKTFR